jgi:2-dehydro-3-deoxygluconokinase
MARLAAPGKLRLGQALPGALEVTFAGAEANVAASVCLLGGSAALLTALPRNVLGDACLSNLRSLGIDTRYVVQTDAGRLGLYFVEAGANQRPGTVLYDRSHSATAVTPGQAYDWPSALRGADWFHVSGITPALSRAAAEAVLVGIRTARELGVCVSCDLNFRSKLWRWDADCPPRELAERTMRGILPQVDLLLANEEDAASVLGIHAERTDVHSGEVPAECYPEVARRLVEMFPNLSRVAITLRQSLSASHNNWGGMLYTAREQASYFAPLKEGRYQPYEIRNIVDRIGAGDAFAAGLLLALETPELASPQTAVSFAAAASCLAHSVAGDFNRTSREEVEALMRGAGAGRVVR